MVEQLRKMGHEVYDFRNPPNGTDFSWRQVAYHHEPGTTPDISDYLDAIQHPVAEAGFNADFEAMKWADTFVLLLPCGRSAHIEAGWAMGQGKPTHIVLSEDKFEPELMYLIAGHEFIHDTPETFYNAIS